MENTDIISDLKNYLLDFEYPLANTMNHDQLAEIFNRSNRCFLVTWIINHFNEACGHTIENMENTEQYLGNLIHEMGICKKVDSIPFMRGELPLSSQLQIIQKLLNCLRNASVTSPQVDIWPDFIENLKTLDLNLFPQYGDIKIKSSIPKENSIGKEEPCPSYQNKIEQPKIDYVKFYEDLELWVEKTREEFPLIKSKILTIVKLKDQENQNKEIMHIDPDSTEGFQKCNKYLKIVNQYLTDLYTISEFSKDDVSDSNKSIPKNEEWRKMLHGIYEEIVEVVKYSNLKD